jgi:hypothetical protein
MPSLSNAVPRQALARLASAALAALAVPAFAQDTSPWYIGVTQSFSHDDRVRRAVATGSDTISSTGVLGGVDIKLGRQHVYADFTASKNNYSRFKELDHMSHSLTAGLDWETVERLSGKLRYLTSKSLIDYGSLSVPTSDKDIQTVKQAVADVRYGFASSMSITAGAEDRRVDFSAPTDPRDYTQKVGRVGLSYSSSDLLTLGAGVRTTKGDYPSAIISPFIPADPNAVPPTVEIPAVFGPDETDRRDVYATATWKPTGLSTLTGRVSATRIAHTQPSIPDLSTWTGSLTWDYLPTAKLAVKTALIRDTGSETLFIEDIPPGLLPLRPEGERVGTVLSVQANYALTAKIGTFASVRHRRTSTDNDFRTSSRSSNVYSIGANYAPTRTVNLGCSFTQERQGRSYTSNLTTCFGQFVLR